VPVVAEPMRPVHRFSVEQYHRMIEAGILSEHDRVELLEGVIVEKMTHNPPHDGTVLLVQTVLLTLLPADWVLRVQSAITLADGEPEPDLAVARGPVRRYVRAHPGPRDLALVIEVAEATLLQDQTDKARTYARARIPVYWIVNLINRRIEVYTQPRGGRAPAYRQRQDYPADGQVPLVIAGAEVARIAVADLLP
jgi:Uma2 family endonuclease